MDPERQDWNILPLRSGGISVCRFPRSRPLCHQSCDRSVSALNLILFLSIAAVVYVYFGYPAVLWIVSRFARQRAFEEAAPSKATILIAAFNEEAHIAQKIGNCLELDGMPGGFDLVIVSDGSTDRTVEIAQSFKPRGVKVLPLERIGKVRALNRAFEMIETEIVILTDANSVLERDAVHILLQPFGDPSIGCVCGNQRHSRLDGSESSAEGEGLYWRYDKWIKSLESKAGGTIAADGSLYAIRRALFQPIEEPAQPDDMAISMRIATQGYRIHFAEEAVSYEPPSAEGLAEFRRKVRIANQSIRGLVDHGKALNPFRHGTYALKVISHKVMRYLVPVFLLAAFLANGILALDSENFQILMLGQMGFYVLAAAGYVSRARPVGRSKLLFAPYYFCLANLAVLIAILGVLSGRRYVMWDHTRTL